MLYTLRKKQKSTPAGNEKELSEQGAKVATAMFKAYTYMSVSPVGGLEGMEEATTALYNYANSPKKHADKQALLNAMALYRLKAEQAEAVAAAIRQPR